MQTSNNKYILGVVMLATLLFSCKKDFLEIQPTDRFPEETVITDTSVFEAYVINRYIGARLQDKEGDGTDPGFGRGFEYSMWSSITDESIYNNDDNTWTIQRGLLAPENLGMAGTIWPRSYRSIREVNFALNTLRTITMSQAHKDRLKAELQFIRAFRYHDLIRNYGGVVLMGDTALSLTDNLQNDAFFKRATLKESIDYTVAQLDAAAAVLPVNNDGNWPLGRATKGAALALKARLLLYAASPLYATGTWADAATAAQAVISMNKYGIYQDGYGKLFLTTDGNNEIIFARLYTKNANHTHLEIANGPNGYGGWGGNLPMQNLVDDYRMMDGTAITDPGTSYNPATPYANRDPRFYATILYNGATYRGATLETFTPGGKDSKDGPDNWNTSKTGYYLKKFMNDAYPLQNPWGNAGFQPWIYFRYAEVLLNYAEAANEAYGPDVVPAGSTFSARAAVNQVRARSGVNMPPVTAVSQTQLRDIIRSERRVELAFEEHRFYDVRRWKIADVTENKPAGGIIINKVGNNFTYTPKVALDGRKFLTQHYWLPIPRAEIQASGNKIKQNDNY
ncbi:RagB/SusD family nutrient uptake outer membrane protein [Paraflavitalea soli]|uniref:RagB/SusD family nutrient uptake outer membrane protein n=1 Tax=Paraflavitalea soli TaxID=2315862 RepID=A0A3B7N7Z3_9BACT|nr:RagB/SusD family nutrient uptake outer membrane protein [Paraflavitalea soli]AXY78001.1 RagB/SusD family nutrient uptake outer membrane protein [Paraflavitalea soli]